jgi:hypothetical protein
MAPQPVAAILKNQSPEGFWVSLENLYLPKYRATSHQLLILSELGASLCTKIENAIKIICETYQYDSGRFSMKMIKTERGRKSTPIDGACLTGNIVRSFILDTFRMRERRKLLNFW